MPRDQGRPTRADLPAELTPETVRRLPMSVLQRLRDPRNGVLTEQEQTAFDAALHEVMSETAGRVSQQLRRSDWARVRREAHARQGRRGGPGRSSQVDEQLRRLTERIDQQVDVAEALAPAVDWSFAQTDDQPDEAPVATSGSEDDGAGTVSDLEQRLTEQVELVQVMSEIADVGKRTYELEQQRDLQNTRTVFFGFVVSVAVIVAGWAPVVAADDWSERLWILGLTVATCLLAGAVYALVRKGEDPDAD